MKKLILMAAIALVSLQTINAQEPKKGEKRMNPQEMVEKRVKMLDKHLDLTDQQEAQVKSIYTEAFSEKVGPKERKAKMDAANKKVESVLTTEQKTKFQKISQRLEQRKGGEKGGKKGCGKECKKAE